MGGRSAANQRAVCEFPRESRELDCWLVYSIELRVQGTVDATKWNAPQVHPAREKHLRSITRFLTVDAASDEILSTMQMKGLPGTLLSEATQRADFDCSLQKSLLARLAHATSAKMLFRILRLRIVRAPRSGTVRPMPLLLGSMPEIKTRIAGNPERVWSTIGLPQGDPLTPNVEAIMRDAAHAQRRVMGDVAGDSKIFG